eukprot:COSAG01_NODE_89_length_27311_cov_22.687061_16_plen_95_part_00
MRRQQQPFLISGFRIQVLTSSSSPPGRPAVQAQPTQPSSGMDACDAERAKQHSAAMQRRQAGSRRLHARQPASMRRQAEPVPQGYKADDDDDRP